MGELLAPRYAPFDLAVRLTDEPISVLPCNGNVDTGGIAYPGGKFLASTFPKAQGRADRVCLGTFRTSFQSIPMRLEALGMVG